MKFESWLTSNSTSKSEQNNPHSDKYEAHLYNPNNGLYYYLSRILARCYMNEKHR